jgi:hypothetical protein
MLFFCVFEGIAYSFENPQYVKPPNEGIVGYVSRVFFTMGGIAKLAHLMHVVHIYQTIRSRLNK